MALLLPVAAVAEIELRSGETQNTLVELYTSEGCSSCPPADRWYSSLREHPQLWHRIVPVAYHVDYWNYLGWRDPFSQSKFSHRQRRHVREGNITHVYTPGVLALGKEWRNWRYGWRYGETPPLSERRTGVLQLNVTAGEFEASFAPQNPSTLPASTLPASTLTIALLGTGLSTAVRSGENRGKTLRHDFVVLASRSYHSSDLHWQGELPNSTAAHQPQQTAWAAWVSREGSLKPIQAVGGWRQ